LRIDIGILNFETMNVEDILFNEAIEKSELVQYLGGYPDYYIQPQAADLPTEYDVAFDPIRRRIKDEPELGGKALAAIKALADDPVYGWGAIFHIGNLALMRQYEGIDLITPELLTSVAESLRHNRDAFKALKRWEGKNHEDGVWTWVRVKNRNLHTKHGVTVLPEEL
jgi:hypothetical protein